MRVVKTLLTRCREVVDLMAANRGPARLSDIATGLDLPKSATHRLLRELCTLGWVEQDGADGPYRLSLAFALLGQRVLHATGLPDLTQPLLDRLAGQTRELVRLTVATADGLAWLGAAQGAPPGLMYQPTMDGPVVLHATANGKALLATLPEPAALALARAGGFGRLAPTRHTITDEAALRADLDRVRRRGYGLADQEAELGVTAVAVALPGGVGTLSVAGPSLRLPPGRLPELAAQLADTAAALASVWPSFPFKKKVQTS